MRTVALFGGCVLLIVGSLFFGTVYWAPAIEMPAYETLQFYRGETLRKVTYRPGRGAHIIAHLPDGTRAKYVFSSQKRLWHALAENPAVELGVARYKGQPLILEIRSGETLLWSYAHSTRALMRERILRVFLFLLAFFLLLLAGVLHTMEQDP